MKVGEGGVGVGSQFHSSETSKTEKKTVGYFYVVNIFLFDL